MTKNRDLLIKPKEVIILMLKGIGIGSANVIPGVSGGTIALLTGIYERLINSIKSFNLRNLSLLLKGKVKDFLKATDFLFLLSVMLGVVISTYSLAKLLVSLLENYPLPTWSFFFGLVLISCFFVSKEITNWNTSTILSLIIGIAIAIYISFASPTQTPDSKWFLMLCGAIAICAMILPGISGSFILVLFAKYEFIMNAIGNLDIPVIAYFLIGAVIGLLLFSHLLSWLFKRFRNQTIAALTGFMIGSLLKLSPWQTEDSLLARFPEQWGLALLFALLGIAVVVTIELLARRIKK